MYNFFIFMLILSILLLIICLYNDHKREHKKNLTDFINPKTAIKEPNATYVENDFTGIKYSNRDPIIIDHTKKDIKLKQDTKNNSYVKNDFTGIKYSNRDPIIIENTKKDIEVKTTYKEPVHKELDIELQYELLPYKQKSLLTKTEHEFARYLVHACTKFNIKVYPKVRMEDFIDVTTIKYRMKYRGYIKSRHIDFLLCDTNFNILCAIELDDNSHNTQSVQKTDVLKNRIYKSIDLKLFRIKVNSDWKKEIVEVIKYCYTRTKTNTNT